MTKQDLKDYRSILCEIGELERLATEAEAEKAAAASPFVSFSCDRRLRSYRRDLDLLTIKRNEIEEAVNVLPSLERRVVRLKYFEGLSWVLVADRLGYSEEYVRKRIFVSALKKILAI